MAKKKIEMEQEVINEVIDNEVQNENVQAEEKIPELTLDDFKSKVTVKPCVGIFTKKAIIQSIYDNSVVQDEINGVYYIDTIMLNVAFDLCILDSYTDFYDVNKYAAQYGYDYLKEIGVFDYVYEIVNAADINDIQIAVDQFYSRVTDLNSVGAFIYRILGDSTKKMFDIQELNKLFKDIPKVINGVDKEVIKVFAKELGSGNIGSILKNRKDSNVTNIADIKK